MANGLFHGGFCPRWTAVARSMLPCQAGLGWYAEEITAKALAAAGGRRGLLPTAGKAAL